MCFSAGASFGASAILGVVGAIAISKAKTSPERLFAATPLLFAVQQFTEGMLWLSLKNPGLEPYQSFFTYTFLVFAMMVWPTWIPYTIRRLEKDENQKKIMNVLLSLGIVISLGIGYVLVVYPVQVMTGNHHLHYMFDFPAVTKSFIWLFTILYCMTTIVTPFISSIKRMRWLGFIFLASWLFALFFYNGFVVSIWCYFAAVMSIVVVWIVAGISKKQLAVEVLQ